MSAKSIFVIALSVFCLSAKAQFPYSYSVTKEPYIPLTGGISVTNGQLWDEEVFTIPIGFPLMLGDKKIDSFLLAGPTFLGYMNHDSEATGFWTIDADLCDRGIHDSSASVSPITYTLTGNTGNRIFKIEYANLGFWEEMNVYGTNNDYANMQVWAYEADNSVELRYGPSKIINPQSYFFFGDAPAACYLDQLGFFTDFSVERLYYLYGDPATPILDSTTDILQTRLLNHMPDPGTVYRFRRWPVFISTANTWDNVNIYPTFCDGKLYIDNNTSSSLKYTITNITGASTGISGAIIQGKNSISVETLPVGAYIINLTNSNGRMVSRFIKQ